MGFKLCIEELIPACLKAGCLAAAEPGPNMRKAWSSEHRSEHVLSSTPQPSPEPLCSELLPASLTPDAHAPPHQIAFAAAVSLCSSDAQCEAAMSNA